MKTDVPPCPRRKITGYSKRYDHGWWTFTLHLACGHIFKPTHKREDWTPPKTTQCGQCWRETSKRQPFWEDLADQSKDGFKRDLNDPNV